MALSRSRSLFKGALLGVTSTVVFLFLALLVAVALTPLPEALRRAPPEPGLVVYDRSGNVLAQLAAPDRVSALSVRLSDVSSDLTLALLAAEDARFYQHLGVDPLATLRALWQWIRAGHVVSGGSTLTQQLARSLFARPYSLLGKLHEALLALRIERSLSKPEILEEYLNRVYFGPNLRGLGMASEAYFDKPPSKLDLAEAATLAAIPRGPSLYDPTRHPETVRHRRDRILTRMLQQGLVSEIRIQIALQQPLSLHRPLLAGGAEHLVRALARGKLEPSLRTRGPLQRLTTTLDLNLQRELEGLVRQTRQRMEDFHGSAAAALIIDNATSEVLGYVGAPEFASKTDFGQNDGVLARRQPGSALKPFVYATAIERAHFTAATLLPDLELNFPSAQSNYSPRNYDRRFHGPVRLRQALASSFNVPAAYTASRVGPKAVLDTLHAFGFSSLDQTPDHYGVAIALGDGEVSLGELGAAYATLARGGLYRSLRFATRAVTAAGATILPTANPQTRVIAAETAAILTSILSDRAARAPGFGENSVLDLPFPVAAKTGTSRAFRDNWAVGYTREVTVAVWVGNFDGTPLEHSTGITGAGPLLRDALLLAMRARVPAPLFESEGLVARRICPLSGKLATDACPQTQTEWFTPSQVPHAECDMHRRVWVDRRSGASSGPGCANATPSVFEVYPSEYANWALAAGRPLAPTEQSACGEFASSRGLASLPAIEYPFQRAKFFLDSALPRAQQGIVLRARAENEARLRFFLNGRLLAELGPPFNLTWPLQPGSYELSVETRSGARSQPITFSVE